MKLCVNDLILSPSLQFSSNSADFKPVVVTNCSRLVDAPFPDSRAHGNEEEGTGMVEDLLPPNMSADDLDLLVVYLDEVTRVLADAPYVMVGR